MVLPILKWTLKKTEINGCEIIDFFSEYQNILHDNIFIILL